MAEDQDRTWGLTREIRSGRVSLRQYERDDAQGVAQRIWAVGRDDGRGGGAKLVTMTTGDLNDLVQAVRDLVQTLRRERERPQATGREPPRAPERGRSGGAAEADRPKVWHAVVKVVEVGEGGAAKVEVVKTFDDPMDALRYRDKNKGLCLHAEPFFGHRPADGTKLDVRYGEGRREDLDREVDQFLKRRERGTTYGWGVWWDKGSPPEVGRKVFFTAGVDYRGLLEDRKVTPFKSEEFGEPSERLFVVFKRSASNPLQGEIAAVVHVKRDAVAKVEELDRRHQDRQHAAAMDPQQWRQQTFSMQMRREFGL